MQVLAGCAGFGGWVVETNFLMGSAGSYGCIWSSMRTEFTLIGADGYHDLHFPLMFVMDDVVGIYF